MSPWTVETERPIMEGALDRLEHNVDVMEGEEESKEYVPHSIETHLEEEFESVLQPPPPWR
jgi:hypothetical protein